MKVSPLDLRQVRFRKAFRGFDKAEVLALIAEVTDDYENALSEVDRLRQEVSKMEALLNQHREHERDLRDTLVTVFIAQGLMAIVGFALSYVIFLVGGMFG